MFQTYCLSELAECHPAVECDTLTVDGCLVLLDWQIVLYAYSVHLGLELFRPHELVTGRLDEQNLVLEDAQLLESLILEDVDDFVVAVLVILVSLNHCHVCWQLQCHCDSLCYLLHRQ